VIAPDVTIGTIVGPHGIRGEVKVRLDTDFPERFEELDEVWVEFPSGKGRMIGIQSARFHREGFLLKFAGIDDRTTAEDLRGAELRIGSDERKALEAGQFYIHDLIGLDVFTSEGEHLGRLTEVLQGVANDIYVTPKGMIPALKQFVKDVDLGARKMIVEREGVFEE
jgi:16S rRNA processing protein RimM